MSRVSRFAILLAVLTLVAAACGQARDTGLPGPNDVIPTETGHAEPTESPTGEPNGGGEMAVNVVDSAFEPAQVTVKAGTTVVWTQTGSLPHNVVADDNSFNSHPDCPQGPCMQQGDTFRHTFEEPGEISYYCVLHGAAGGVGMAGVITVEA